MLVRLTSNKAGEMIMFAESAHALFAILGKGCTQRGVFTVEQLPEAIDKLQQAIDEDKLARHLEAREAREEARRDKAPQRPVDDDDKEAAERRENFVHLGQRAYPLLHFFEQTRAEQGFILWEADQDF